MAIIDSIKDKLGNIIYPKTLTRAVYEEITNKRLDIKLNEQDDKIGILSTKVSPETPLNTTSQNLSGAVNEVKSDVDSHKAETIHQGKHSTLEATSTDNATSSVNAPLKSAGGLAVAKDVMIGRTVYAESLNVGNGAFEIVTAHIPELLSNEHIEIEFSRRVPGIHFLATLSLTEYNTSVGDFLSYVFSGYIGSRWYDEDNTVLLSKGWSGEDISYKFTTTGKGSVVISNNKDRTNVSVVLEMRSYRGYDVSVKVVPN